MYSFHENVAAGITILILDHLLTLNRETQLVWPLKAGYLKWAFLVNRYLVPLVLVLFMHSMLPHCFHTDAKFTFL